MKRTSSYVEYSMHDYVLALTYLSSYSFKVSHRCWWATQKPNQQTLPSQMLSDVTGNLERAGTSTFVWKNQRFNDGFQWENYPENGPFHLDVWLMVIIYNDSSGNDGFQWEKGVVFRFFSGLVHGTPFFSEAMKWKPWSRIDLPWCRSPFAASCSPRSIPWWRLELTGVFHHQK